MSGYDGRAHERSGRGAWPVVLAGVLAAAVIAITVAFVVVSGGRSGGGDGGGFGLPDDVGGTAAAVQNSPMSLPEESTAVPDACSVVRAALADSLVPDADRTNLRSPDTTDTHTDCAWSQYGAKRSRQLSVELRAVQAAGGRSATAMAKQAFQDEWRADGSGKGLLSTQHVVYRKVIVDIGDEAYVTYSSDKVQGLGEAVVNVRIVNVLLTVHYVGGDVRRNGKALPLAQARATAAAITVARQAATALTATR